MATYKKYAAKDNTPIQVQSAIEDGAGKNIQNDYAKQDGYYEGLTAGYADNLTPYSPDSGVYQSIPYNFQPTGCGNGETQVDTGSFAYLREKRGNGIVYNQLVQNGDFSNGTTGWSKSISSLIFTVSNNVATITSSVAGTNSIYQAGTPAIMGHKYLVMYDAYGDVGGEKMGYGYGANYQPSAFTLTTTKKTYSAIFSPNSTDRYFSVYLRDTGTVYVSNVICIDLTKWFNGNIPQYLLDHPESFFRYYSGDLSYNVGETKFSNARYLDTYSRNQWDEEYTAGGWINDNGTIGTGYANRFCSKNFIRVDPNTEYYFRVPYSASDYGVRIGYYDSEYNVIKVQTNYGARATMPANCIYIKFATTQNYGSTTYNNDVTVSIYYDGESGYDKYYPYEILQTIDTGTEQLYSAGLAYDRKEPSGLITRNIGSVDLGSLSSLSWGKYSFEYDGQTHYYFSASNSPFKGMISGRVDLVANGMCAKYQIADYATVRWGTYPSLTNNRGELDCIAFYTGLMSVYDKSLDNASSTVADFKAANVGTMVYGELATPTTEQGTPFTESIKIDDFGSMSLESANGVPQGNLIFYPVDYKAFVDTLVNYTEGDATSLAKKSDIVQELPDAPSTNGNYRLRCTVADAVETYTWVAENANPIMHANIFRGKNLGTAVTNEQKTAIQNGTFEDLFVGDYWVINGITWRIADMDYFYQVGDTAFTKHHLVMIPDENLYSYVMNDSATTEGGYVGSKMYTTGLEQAKTTINSAFGSLVQTHRDYLTNATIDGRPSGVAWFDSTVELMNEVMAYGCYIKAAMGTGVILPANHTTAKKQLSIFRLNPKMLNRRKYIWLRDIVSSFAFALVVSNGVANAAGANSSAGVLPYFVIG